MSDTPAVVREIERVKRHSNNDKTMQVTKSVESYMEDVVNEGTTIPNTDITMTRTLTQESCKSGEVEQDITGIFAIGLLLGSALERDIPSDSDAETAWKNGELSLGK